MHKLPKSPHPVSQLTTTELGEYIEQLKDTLKLGLDDDQREIVIKRLREAYLEQNHRAGEGAMKPVAEVTNPDVIKLLDLP